MRAVLVATVGAAVVLAATACGSGQSGPTYPVNVYVYGKHFATVAPGQSLHRRRIVVQIGVGRVVLHVDDAAAQVLIDRALAKRSGRVDVPYTRFASFIKAPAQKPLFKHDSEVTALSMLASAIGIDAPQVHLVKQVKRSGPLDPQPIPGSKLFRWGDPDRGFVGRYNGPGRAGFGVYQEPIRQLAAKTYGIHLVNFSGKSFDAVRAALLNGVPIIAWVGTAPGPTSTWVTPSGKKITVNLTEQAILLTGVGPGYYLLNDPVKGLEYKWSVSRFEHRWDLLGRRALELQPAH